MREDLKARLAAWNQKDLTEEPPEKRREPKSEPLRKPDSKSYTPKEKTVPPPAPILHQWSGSRSHKVNDDLAALLPGYECGHNSHGRYYCVETPLHGLEEWRPLGEAFSGFSSSSSFS